MNIFQYEKIVAKLKTAAHFSFNFMPALPIFDQITVNMVPNVNYVKCSEADLQINNV